MADKSKKRVKTAAEKLAQQNRSSRNKVRRLLKLTKYLQSEKCAQRAARRAEKAHAKRMANAMNLRYKPGPNEVEPKPEIPLITVRLKEGNSVHVLTVEQTVDGPRDKTRIPKEHQSSALGNLISSGGITFLTAAGKKWHMKLNEFSIVVNHK